MKRILQLSVMAIALSIVSTSTAQVDDSSFEAGVGGGSWTEASTNFGSPLCDFASCGDCGGECVAKSGSFYAWFGGAGAVETGSVEQSVMIPTGTSASFDLYVKIALAGDGLVDDRLEVSIDGTLVASVTALDSSAYVDYTELSVDASAMADGTAHTLRIEGFQTTTSGWNILVDDVTLSVDGTVTSIFEEVMEPRFKVFPNPATDAINLTFGEVSGNANVSIVAVDGTIVATEIISEVFNKNFEFDSSNLDNGVYLVNVTNDGVTTTQRIVVSK